MHISENLSVLEASTFNYCTSLVELYVPGSVTLLSSSSVGNCSSLKRLKIGEKDATGSTIIGNCAVIGNNQLERLELGANVDSLVQYSLDELNNLKVFICWAPTPPKLDDYQCFSPAASRITAPLYVRRASLDAYRTTRQWKDFQTIVAIEDVGDMNGDGSLTVGDVTALISKVLNGDAEGNVLADVNLDGVVNIADVTALISRVLSGS